MENRNIRASISVVLMAIVSISFLIAIGSDDTFSCVVSFLTMISGFYIGARLGL